MSTVFLHVGQCGNQLGQAFWEEASTSKWSCGYQIAIHTDNRGPSSKVPIRSAMPASVKIPQVAATTKLFTSPKKIPFALVDGSLPCVLIDAEPKVIRRCLDKKRGSAVLTERVRKECCVCDRTGRGNNWAYGYHGTRVLGGQRDGGCGQDLLGRVRDLVRKVVERCNRFSGFIVLHSIAGGTGSGLGSALLETLRTDYPLSFIITVTVAPFSQGETPLQHLNSLLCLSWLQSYSDAVLLFGNDSVLEQAQKYLTRSERTGVGSGSGGRGDRDMVCDMEDMNGHISGALCNTFMPLWQNKQKLPNLAFQQPWEIIRSLCPDPKSKFITPDHIQLSKPSNGWSQATTLLLQRGSNTLWGKEAAVKARTSSLACIIRSTPSNVEQFAQGMGPLEAKLKKAYKTVDWNPFPVDYLMSYEPSMGQTKVATVLANSSVVLEYVETVHGRAKVMFQEGAYLHWYERYGCERGTFEQAFESVHEIIDNYIDI